MAGGFLCGIQSQQEANMDSFVLHPTPAAWLQQSKLAEFAPSYREHLASRRYAISTQRIYLRCVAHFAHWLTEEQRSVFDISRDVVGHFLDQHLPHCTCPAPAQRKRVALRAALGHLLAVLIDQDVVPASPVGGAIEEELRRFDEHMDHLQGLASSTRVQRLRILRAFFLQKSDPDPTALTPVNANDLRRFISLTLRRLSPSSAGVLATALRCYLRFRARCGDQVDDLLPIIQSPACWRHSSLPETLSPEEVSLILAYRSPHGRTARRSHAMIRCLVDLGLRASEVSAIGLSDLDWSAGRIRIGPGKCRRIDMMPLPQTTGQAIVQYLRTERPRSESGRVFVRHVAPLGEPIGPGVVRRAAYEAYRACGLRQMGVHILRHTLADRLIQGGATLKDVADVLRHRDLNTTLIYTKIDTARLEAVAMLWPGAAS
jgi:integrase/recombinase XerD